MSLCKKVFLDATAVDRQPSGARLRIAQLYSRLAAMPHFQFTICLTRGSGLKDLFLSSGAQVKELSRSIPAPLRGIQGLNPLHRIGAKDMGFHIYGAETLLLPRLKIPVVFTLHDLRFLHQEYSPIWRVLFARMSLKGNLNRARKIVTVSQSTALELVSKFPHLEDKTIVAPNGPPPAQRLARRVTNSLLRRMGVNRPYLFCISHLEKRKNLLGLIQAFKKDASLRSADLILAGQPKPGFRSQLLHEAEGIQQIKILMQVTEEEKSALYEGCRAVISPSRYEGFGLGVLEALSYQKPMACSRIPAHREVGGQGVLFFDPYSVAEMADAAKKILFDGNVRSRLARNRETTLSKYSWEKTAEILSQLYLNLAP